MQISVGELRFDVVVDGPEDGTPVLLLHGWPESGRSWQMVADGLVRTGHRVLIPDQRGYSPGARPEGVAAYDVRELADDAIGILDALGLSSAHLVGHDWGAIVAWCVAAWHPERTRSLTAVSVPHPKAFSAAINHDPDQQQRSAYIGLLQTEGKAEHVLLAEDGRRLREMLAGVDQDAVDHYVALLSEPGALTATLNWYRAMGSGSLRTVGPIQVPTTYVWSTGDLALGRAGAEWCGDSVEGPYEFVVLDGVSHWIPEHAPDQLLAAIRARIKSTEGKDVT